MVTGGTPAARVSRVAAAALLLAGLVAGGSLAVSLAGSQTKKAPLPPVPVVVADMTVERFAVLTGLPDAELEKLLGRPWRSVPRKTLGETNIPLPELQRRTARAMAFAAEEGAKSWGRILVKFLLWLLWLPLAAVLLVRRQITPGRRKLLLLGAVAIFGVALGSDPSPMGTVKDAVVLLGREKIVFPPRLVALGIFLAFSLPLNRLICSWGCQAGTLQDLLFRLNRNAADSAGTLPQWRIPFVVSGTVRVAVFLALAAGAFLWSVDILHPLDPFRIFSPASLGLAGAAAVGMTLVASLFVYRPWCHLACPFGLLAWLLERWSRWRVRVDYGTCIACGACARACPTTVMRAVLLRRETIPDCYSCGTCLGVCPTGAVKIGRGGRETPPPGKFPPSLTT